jgi:3-phenylpropionate/trans-cinnamate dioxygenase ferredoxin subunit
MSMSAGPILVDNSNPNRWAAVCTRDHLNEQKVICANVAGIDLIVVQDGEVVYACERVCPHEQADLSLGRVADGRLYCPRHLAWFDLKDGNISPGWSSRALRRYSVRVADDQIWVDADVVLSLSDGERLVGSS